MRTRSWIILIGSVPIIAGSGCGEDTTSPLSSEPGIAPLEALTGEHDGPRVTDVTDRSAWVRFDAEVPVVCNVVYGETTEYGQVALMSMTAATTDHDVQIVGLEPETTYHFRVTVTDLSGRVYQSEDGMFTTSPLSKEGSRMPPAGRNVALLPAGTTVAGVSAAIGATGTTTAASVRTRPSTEMSGRSGRPTETETMRGSRSSCLSRIRSSGSASGRGL